MTEEERDYHYFRLHDYDQNDKLDGQEILKVKWKMKSVSKVDQN